MKDLRSAMMPGMLRGSWYILGIFLITGIADFVSTLRVPREFLQHLESNPFYSTIGIAGIAALNLAALWWFLRLYDSRDKLESSRISRRISAVTGAVWIGAVRTYLAVQNWQVGDRIREGAVTVEQAAQVTEEMKWMTILTSAAAVMIPVVITWVCFYIIRLDHTISEK